MKILSILSLLSFLVFSGSIKAEEIELESSILSGIKPRLIGPGITSGRIGDIAVNPQNHSEFYVGVASGNVFKTTNGGTTFSPVFDNQEVYSIGTIELDPNNPHTVWVGTGENNSQRSVAWGDGVYKSTDGGKSWKNMGLKESEHIAKIIIHPKNSNVIYVASQGPLWKADGDRGLYKSTDGGETWEKSLYVSENTGVSDMVMDPRNCNVMYATSYQRRRHQWTLINGGPEGAVYKTTDGGENWFKIMNGMPSGDIGRIGLAISPVNPDYVYAIVEAAEGGGFYRSTNRGATWEKRGTKISASAQYYQEIVAHPHRLDWVINTDTYTQYTDDGGLTWHNIPTSHRHVDDHAIWINPDDPNEWLIGGDGGLYRTYDEGKTWDFMENLPVTQFYRVQADNDTPFYNVYGGTQDNNSLGAPHRTTHDGGIYNQDWLFIVGGDGYEPQIDPTNPDIIYGQWQYGNIVRYDKSSGEITGIQPQADEDEELRWNWDTPLIISPHNHKRLYVAANKVFRSDDMGNSWTKISDDLTRQIDRNQLEIMGKVWSPEAVAKNQSTSLFGNIISLEESPVQEGLLYVGTDDGLIQVTEDGGQNWRKIESFDGVPEWSYVSDVFASRHDANVVYASFNNHKKGDFKPYILMSNDKGKTWKSIASNLPDNGPVWTIEQDTEDPNLLFVGTEFAFFTSTNNGDKWIRIKSGFPTIAVRDLDIQERESDLVIGTFGRGIYIIDDYSPLRYLNKETLNKDANLFPVKDAIMFIENSSHARGANGNEFYRAENPPFGAIFTYYLKEVPKTLKELRKDEEAKVRETKGLYKYPSFADLRLEDLEDKPYLIFTIEDMNGNAIRHLTEPAKSGVNRINWDLRYASQYPVGKNTKVDKHSAMPVVPGKYKVSMSLFHNDKIEKLAGPVEFNTKPLDYVTLPADDKNALAEFQQKMNKLSGAVQATSKLLNELDDKIQLIRKTIKVTENSTPALLEKTYQIDDRLKDFDKRLNGDKSISKRAGNQTPSISDRVGYAVFTMWYTTSAPTQTSRKNYEIAGKQLEALLTDINNLINTEIKPLENELDELNAPWTPGRMPEFKME
jgi:photosystem II stability/assembly factor-like uncharacterized protein